MCVWVVVGCVCGMFCGCVSCEFVLHAWGCLMMCVWLGGVGIVEFWYCFAYFGHGCFVCCQFGVRVVYVWCLCGELLVWMGVSWVVLVVCI